MYAFATKTSTIMYLLPCPWPVTEVSLYGTGHYYYGWKSIIVLVMKHYEHLPRKSKVIPHNTKFWQGKTLVKLAIINVIHQYFTQPNSGFA